jgi:hypothetical protein
MVLGDKDYRDTGSCSHCHCCTTGRYWCILLYLSLISPLGKYCADGCRAFPPHDESTMTLAPLLQHFEDTNVAMVLGPGTEMVRLPLPSFPSPHLACHSYTGLIWAGRMGHARLPKPLKIDFIFLAFRCNHRVVHLVDSSDSRRAAHSVPSDPNRNDPPYKGCMCRFLGACSSSSHSPSSY